MDFFSWFAELPLLGIVEVSGFVFLLGKFGKADGWCRAIVSPPSLVSSTESEGNILDRYLLTFQHTDILAQVIHCVPTYKDEETHTNSSKAQEWHL